MSTHRHEGQDSSPSRTILVTGCSGYVGASLVPKLRLSLPGSKLKGLDVGFFIDQIETFPPPEVWLDSMLFRDIRDVRAEDLLGVTDVVHLAALSNDPLGDKYAAVTEEINRSATLKLAKLARDAGCSNFVFASSASVYGAAGNEPKSESSIVNPQTSYARSKIASEEGLQRLATEEFRVTSLRFATACGWSNRVRLDIVLNDFVASAVTTGVIRVLSDGSPLRPLVHVDDMVRAIEWSLDSERQSLPPFIVANIGCADWNFSIGELAIRVATELANVDVEINENAAPDTRSYQLDFTYWRTIAPNHQPQATVSETVAALAGNLSPRLESDDNTVPRIRLRRVENLVAAGILNDNLRFPTQVGTV